VLLGLCLSVPPQLAQQFMAETKVTSKNNGVIENEQHDFIWVDVLANKMKTISVDEIFGTNNTVIYRGDLKKEYYIINDLQCFFSFAPPDLNIKLQIRDNSTLQGDMIVNGENCELWVYKAMNEKISYYVRQKDFSPVKIELMSGSHVDTIEFLKFNPMVPDRNTFEVNSGLHCDSIKIGTKKLRREEMKKYFDVVPRLIEPKKKNGIRSRATENAIDPATLELIGKTLWAIIKENKPEANLENILNAVVPNGTTWTDLTGWRQQKWPGWQWTLVNPYGVNVVDYKWSFNFLCKGNYKNIGQYIQNAGAFPMIIDVSWGYKVNVRGQVLNPFNFGTAKNPIAGLTLSMTMDVNTIIKKISQTCTVNLIGDCSTEVLSCNGYKSTNTFSYN